MADLYAPVGVLWARIKARVIVDTNGCWNWTGATNSRGYGLIGSGRRSRTELTHRIAILADGRDLPDGLTVDHLCMNKRCVNPTHLEVVTRSENSRRYHAMRREAAALLAA